MISESECSNLHFSFVAFCRCKILSYHLTVRLYRIEQKISNVKKN